MISLKRHLNAFATCLAFLTRLPLPSWLFGDHQSIARVAWGFPLVGLIVGALQTAVVALLVALNFAPPFAAVLMVALSVFLTGALHDDGLADVADGLGGGRRERKLEIMKDSRLGAYGVTAMVLSLVLQFALFEALTRDFQAGQALVVLLGAAVLSRSLMVPVWAFMPSANPEGLAAERPSVTVAGVAIGLAAVVLIALMFLKCGLVLSGLVGALVAASLLGLLARWQFGGATGDVLGAVQKVSELAFFGMALGLITSW